MFTNALAIYQKRLKAEIPKLREIELYLDQYNTATKPVLLIALPAVFIEFIPLATRDLGRRIQSAEASVRMHLVTESVLEKDRLKKNDALDHMLLFDQVYTAISGFSAKLSYLPQFAGLLGNKEDQTVMSSHSRTNITMQTRIEGAKMFSIQDFKTILYDHAAAKSYTKITPEADIKTDLQ